MTADTPSHLVPKLRFPEFRDTPGWSKRPLGEIFTPIVREREKPAVPYTGLGIRSHGRGTFRKELEHPEKTSMDRLYEVDCDDLIVNITFAWEGAIAIVRSEDAGALVSHRFPTYQFDQNAVLTDFFRYPILDKQFIYNLGVISPGGAGRNRVLNKADFLKIELALPEVAEQQKVADCLGSLDDLIAAQGRKLEALRQHKQGLMQQLFPQAGETQPRLRFPEFRNAPEWEEKELGDVSEVLMCKRIFASQTHPNGGVPFYKIGTLGGEPDAFISKYLFEEYKSKYNFPRPGEILITCSGTVGKCLAYDGSEAYFQDSNIVWIDNSTLEVSNEFLLSILSNVNWSTLNSTTITRIYGPDLRGLAIKFPQNEQEQKRIADCLSVLDDQIGVQARKRETLTRHKQGLLQQLFPSLEAESR